MGGDDVKGSKGPRTAKSRTQRSLRRKRADPADGETLPSQRSDPDTARTREKTPTTPKASGVDKAGDRANRHGELFELAPIGYAVLTFDGHVDDVNRMAVEMLGQDRKQLVGRPFVTLLSAASAAVLNDLLKRVIATRQRASCEVDLGLGQGQTTALRLSAALTNGTNPTILLIFHDVTEQRRREERVRSMEEAVREASQRKDEFLAVLSHELRNPLAPIRNCLYVLSRVEPRSEEAKRAHGIIERQVQHLTRLVDDLLDVTRITRGKIQLHRQPLDLAALVRSTVEDHRTSFEQSGVVLHALVDAIPLWVHADSARLVQAMSNLLGNAEKFTPRGGSVTVSLQRAGTMAVLKVRDTGVGIAPRLLQQLFEPFAQAPQTIHRARGGLGLGLAMVKGLVEIHGGSVSITSPGIGLGTTVTLSLPVELTPPPLAKVESPSALGRRILVIEDSPDAAESLREALELGGFEVTVASDGPAAIEHAHRALPEAVLCDLGLAGMSGYDVARSFRADAELRSVYLVALSGYALPEDISRASAAGFDDYVTKPPIMEKLYQLLTKVGSRRQPTGSVVPKTPLGTSSRL
jgi:PAS domain S-box-containing protein